MNKNYTKLFAAIASIAFSANIMAQNISESFDNFAGLTGNGWVINNLSSPIGTVSWGQGDNTSPFPPHSGTGFAFVNYQSGSSAADLSNWLIAPSRTFNNGDVLSFWSRTVDSPAYPDRLEVRLSTNGTSTNVGSTSTSVGDFTTVLLTINPTLTTTGYPSVWTQYTVTISGLAGPTTGRVAFRYFVTNGGPSGNNSDYIGIDEFFCGSSSANVSVTNPAGQYTIIPVSQIAPIPLQARLNNTGTTSITDGTVTVNVFQSPNLVTPVFTQTSANTSLAAGANSLISLGNYTPPATPATYLVRYTSACTGNVITSADTANYIFTVDNKVYARDNGSVTSNVGIGAGPTGYIGSMYTFNTATEIDSVLFANAVNGTSVGDSVKVVVYNVSGGVPTTIIGQSAARIFTVADTVGLNVIQLKVNALNGGPLQLTPGTYFVSIAEHNTNMGLAFCDNIFVNNTVYAGWTNQAFTPVEAFGPQFAKTPIIRPILKSCTNSFATDVQTACGSYTWINGQTYTSNNNTATHVIQNVAGCDSTITLNLTITPLDNATFTYPSNTICDGGPNTTPTLATAGGTFNSTPAGLVFANATTGEINVIASNPGVYSVTYTTAGTCPNTQTQTITITNAPDASFSYANSAYCINGTNPTPIITGSAGSFTSTPSGLSIASGTGVINLGASTPGNYTVTNTIAASGACPQATATATVTVNALPTATITGGGAACAGNNIPLSIALTGAGPWNLTYSDGTNSTPVSGQTTSPFTINASTSGTYTVTTVSDANCSNTGSGSATVTINPLPTATVTGGGSICAGDNASVSIALTGTGPWNFTYSDGTNTTPVTGQTTSPFTFNTSTAGTYTVTTVTDANCTGSGSGSATVTVNALPTVTFTLSNTNVCSSAAPFALSGGSPAGGTYTGAGVSGGQFNAATAGVGTHTITYTFTDVNGCSASATQNITVSVCSGMEESSIAKSLLIAPNPAREQLMISFNNANSNNVQVNIISADGKLVYSENAAAASQYVKYVDVTSFAKGLYFIQIVSEEGMINNKIIVQ